MKLLIIFIILTIFLLIISKLSHSTKERFSQITKEDLQVLNQPFNTKHDQVYKRILKKFDLTVSPLGKKNYCDVLGIFGKKCDLKLTYTNK